jgi:2-amino-4-hydroxy-6-hydroxymethyldihydropteridine diphosphokinase
MNKCDIFLGLGSNVGDRLENLKFALTEIAKLPGTAIAKCSSIYETSPVGYLEQTDFLNMAAKVTSSLSPDQMIAALQDIERGLGRTAGVHWGPRIIDIDILYWGDLVLNSDNLRIPHPEIENRAFVLVPLNEIAPDFLTPPACTPVKTLHAYLRHKSGIRCFERKSRSLMTEVTG